MGKTRRRASKARELPTEILAMIAVQLGIEREMPTLRCLLNTSSAFAEVTRSELYRHIDFRGKSVGGIARLFLRYIAPRFGKYVLSVAFGEDPDEDIDIFGDNDQDSFFSDPLWPRIIKSMPNILSVNLTLPTWEEDCSENRILKLLSRWKSVKHLTLRGRGWGRGDFRYSGDDGAGSLLCAIGFLAALPKGNLETLRLLGVRSTLLDYDPETLSALRFPRLRALHIAGCQIDDLVTAAAAWDLKGLTHLVLAEEDTLAGQRLDTLLSATRTTLRSLAFRQAGRIVWDQHSVHFGPDYWPVLDRLVISLEHFLLDMLLRFEQAQSITTLELGSNDAHIAPAVARLVQARENEAWPALKQLSLVSDSVTPPEWDSIYDACLKRGIAVVAGFDLESDFPCTWV